MNKEAADASFDLQRRYKDIPAKDYVSEMEKESYAFNISIPIIDRIFLFNTKIVSDDLSKTLIAEETPIKRLMTEAFVEGFKRGING